MVARTTLAPLPLHGAADPDAAALAYVHEMFVSFQGEGVLAGTRQLFIRLAGCDIRCPWCDTPEALTAAGARVARIETVPCGPFRTLPNPLTAERVAEEAAALALAHGPLRWASLTGGEPTIWRRFLARLAPLLRSAGLSVYLETNSLHPETLDAMGDAVDFVSADVKLPFADYPEIALDTYRAFFARIRGPGQAKLVIAASVPDADVLEAVRLVGAHAPHLPVVLQPVTPVPGFALVPAPEQLLRQQALALGELADVRIIPQLHKALGVR